MQFLTATFLAALLFSAPILSQDVIRGLSKCIKDKCIDPELCDLSANDANKCVCDNKKEIVSCAPRKCRENNVDLVCKFTGSSSVRT
jgi:hypothetical protein